MAQIVPVEDKAADTEEDIAVVAHNPAGVHTPEQAGAGIRVEALPPECPAAVDSSVVADYNPIQVLVHTDSALLGRYFLMVGLVYLVCHQAVELMCYP